MCQMLVRTWTVKGEEDNTTSRWNKSLRRFLWSHHREFRQVLSLKTRSPETRDGLLPEICIPSRRSLGERTTLYTDIRTASKAGIKLWACGRDGKEIILPESYWSDLSCLLKETTPSPSHQLAGTGCYGLGSEEPSPPLGSPQTFWGQAFLDTSGIWSWLMWNLSTPISGFQELSLRWWAFYLSQNHKIHSNSHLCSK